MNTRELKDKNLSKKYRRTLLILGLTFLSNTQNPEAKIKKTDRFDIIKINISIGQEPSDRLIKNILEYKSEKG